MSRTFKVVSGMAPYVAAERVIARIFSGSSVDRGYQAGYAYACGYHD